jgi:hypothetical protein
MGTASLVLADISTYYEDCIIPHLAEEIVTKALKLGIKKLGQIAMGMACPACLAAFIFIDEARSVIEIFMQVLYLNDYVLTQDYFHQGYAVGKITHELERLVEYLVLLDVNAIPAV